MIKRELYLSKIRNFYDSDLIKVITGVRRCGKSVLLSQIIDELNVDKRQILYMNFEDLAFNDIKTAIDLNHYVKEKLVTDDRYYLFFDEIQNVMDFERAINSLRATENVSIFITGSNGKLLSNELATHLSGRYVSFRMLPFTYREVAALLNYAEPTREEHFLDYVEWGGMPQIYNLSTTADRRIYLEDLYSSIVLKDIVERAGVRDIELLNRIIQFIIENLGGIFSANSVSKFLKSQKINTSPTTVYNYINIISDALIIDRAGRYDIRGKKVLEFYEKFYLADLGLAQIKKSAFEKSVGGRLENIVYNHLIANGYKVHIGKFGDREIDFVIDDFGAISYIQVTDHLSSDAVIEREFGVFCKLADNYPKLVLSLDKLDFSRNGIKHQNIIDFLLGK